MDSDNLPTDPMLEGHEPEENDEAEERRYRAIGIAALIGIAITGMVLFSASNVVESPAVHQFKHHPLRQAMGGAAPWSPLNGFTPSRLVLGHVRILDTIYTTDSIYLDVDLARQHVTVYNRNGTKTTFPISSGNKTIKDAIATPTGVFTVQNKTPLAISKQFKDAKLYWWIGVQGGVGFHGLDGTGYYWNLGHRPSSHGCIRMSREDVKTMYGMVHSGALIRVHDGEPARIFAFCRPSDTLGALLVDSASVHNRNLGRARLRSIMEGRYWVDPQPRLVHIAGKRLRWGMEVGDGTKVPKQSLPQNLIMKRLEPLREPLMADQCRFEEIRRWDFAAARAADSLADRERAVWETEKKEEPVYGE